ncbi:MAG: hypothetical protein OEW90_01920 [Betaproteobacteria bacterium]|nr:hypothetical protein [Betaproteobacteria bacterium]
MRFSALKSVGHNIADSLASGIGLMIGHYAMDVFGEAAAGAEGYIEVDLLHGTTSGSPASRKLLRAISLYSKVALPDLCKKHGVSVEAFGTLRVRFGTDRVYGHHFAVTVANGSGKSSTDHYFGTPGRRLRRRRSK